MVPDYLSADRKNSTADPLYCGLRELCGMGCPEAEPGHSVDSMPNGRIVDAQADEQWDRLATEMRDMMPESLRDGLMFFTHAADRDWKDILHDVWKEMPDRQANLEKGQEGTLSLRSDGQAFQDCETAFPRAGRGMREILTDLVERSDITSGEKETVRKLFDYKYPETESPRPGM